MVLLRELSGRGDFNRKSAANSGFFQAWQSILVEMNRMGDVQPAILKKKRGSLLAAARILVFGCPNNASGNVRRPTAVSSVSGQIDVGL